MTRSTTLVVRIAGAAVAVTVAMLLVVVGATTHATGGTRRDAAHPRVRLVRVADVDTPTAMAMRAGDPTVYVAEQEGRVVAVQDGSVATEPVLDATRRIASGGEQGLLGLTFSPDGNQLYVHFTNRAGDTRVASYDVTNTPGVPAATDLESRRVLLKVRQPDGNHNGGQLAFTPAGDLFLGLGDGGGADDVGAGHAPGGNGQSTGTLLGKIVKVDVFEGDTRFRGGDVLGGTPSVAPVAVFAHERSFCSVIGGYVYRGAAIPDLTGWYVVSDYCDGTLRALKIAGDGEAVRRKLGATSTQVSSFGESPDGELYLLSQDRGLYRIAPR